MLTIEETKWTLKAFKILSLLNILPIKVDVESGKIQRQSNRVKLFTWKILFGVGVAHCFYTFGRLIQSTILEREKYFRWDHFIMHFGTTCAMSAFHYTGFHLFLKTPDETAIIFNQLFVQQEDPIQQLEMKSEAELGNKNKAGVISASGNKTKVKSGAGTQFVSTSARKPREGIEMEVIENQSKSKYKTQVILRPLLAWPPQYSLDELLSQLVTPGGGFTGLLALLILAVDPSRPQLLYSALPQEYKNAWSFFILLVVEAIGIFNMVFIGSFAVVTQVLFFGKCQMEFKKKSLQLRNLQRMFKNHSFQQDIGNGGRNGARIPFEFRILDRILKEMKELVVFIELFNRCFPFCIFAWKICSLSLAVAFYFFAIRHHADFPFLGVFMGYSAIIVTLVYTIMYANAFSIPRKMDELKHEFLLTAQKTTSNSNADADVNKYLRAKMTREIGRIENLGVVVGSFNQMERESTPIFVDFVFKNVVNLLVTFR